MTEITKSSDRFLVILISGLLPWADFGTSVFRFLRQKKLVKKVEKRASEAIRTRWLTVSTVLSGKSL